MKFLRRYILLVPFSFVLIKKITKEMEAIYHESSLFKL